MNSITSQVIGFPFNALNGVPILATGELYPKFELKPGIMLLGQDSQPHELKAVETRRVPAFEIKPQKRESFLIAFDQKIFATRKTGEPLLLTAKDYVDFSKNLQRKFSLAKAILDFPKTGLPLDPYFLGLLLGDGSFRCTPIKLTTPDKEIVEYLYEIAAKYNWPISIEHLKGNLSNHYFFKESTNEYQSLKEIIISLSLLNHKSDTKFIPKLYLYADKKSRQALLAGLFDGHLCFRHYDFLTSSVQLANDVAFLARSLGFLVFENRKPKTPGCAARLYIYGDFPIIGFSEIPIRIKRKVSKLSNGYFEKFAIKSAGIQEIQYLDIESYLQGNCTVRVGDRP
jgi:hypothetical protein